MATYKKINVNKDESRNPQNILDSLEVEEVEDQNTEQDFEVSTSDEEPEPEEKQETHTISEEEMPSHQEPPKEKKKESGAEKRIKQLIKQRDELKDEKDREIQRLRSEIGELQNTQKKSTKTSQETLKGSLEQQVKNLTERMTTAMEEGNTHEVVKIQDELFDTKMQLKSVDQDLSEYEKELQKEEPKQQEKEAPQEEPKVSQKAISWVQTHPMFSTDPVFYNAAMAVNNQLIYEGFDPEEDDFYEALDSRLQPRFPEAFDTEDKNSVEYESEDTNDTTSNEDKTKNPSKKSQEYRETVSGASRSPSASPSQKDAASKSSKNKVKMTETDGMLANRWGLDVKQLARRKQHLEQNRTDDGYVPIKIKKEKQ